MKNGILAVAALVGAVSAGCGAPLFSAITIYKDAFCILQDVSLNSKETNLQVLLAINQAYAPFVRKCQWLPSFGLSQKLDCISAGTRRKTKTDYFDSEDCSPTTQKTFAIGPYQDIEFNKCTKFGEIYAKISEYDAVTDEETRMTTINAQLKWTYWTMMDYCKNIGNFYKVECINSWYYVMENDYFMAVFTTILQWSIMQPVFAGLGWNFLPMVSFTVGVILLIFPDWIPSVKMAPYDSLSSIFVSIFVATINMMKWDWYLLANLFGTFTYSDLDPIMWGWPWVPLWLFYETFWLVYWASPWSIAFNIWWSWPIAIVAGWFVSSGDLSVPFLALSSSSDDSSS